MTKISVYQIDEYVTADDKWIGTDVNTYNKTKNFTPRKLAVYFNGSQVINTGVDLLYKYFTITPPEDRPAGTLSFETEIGPTVNFSAISTFLLSKTTQKGNDVSDFLNFLVNSTSLIYKAKNVNLFGSYKIVSVEPYFLDPNFFVVNVDFLEGNGFIEEDEDYMISIVDLDRTVEVPQLVKETFEYTSSNSFVVANEINNILQVIVNTTSLHPEAYSYTLPSTITIINELEAGDVITVVYNYIEEFLDVPDLQRVTNIGNHTTNNIIIDNVPGEYGGYTVSNTLNDLGTFQSYTSPINVDYQSVYSAYEMSINEIYSPTTNFEMLMTQGIIQTSYTNGSNYNSTSMYSGNSVNGPSLYIGKNNVAGQLKVDNLTNNITLQFPDKPTGTYTIATTADVIPSALVFLDEGGGIGYVINGRTASNYGAIGQYSTDLSYSDSASSVRGATQPYSFASGLNTRASGQQSAAFNSNTIASNLQAFASGNNTTASGSNATAMGGYTTASGFRSMAINSSTVSSGDSSFAGNQSTEARSFVETTLGTLNTLYTPTSTSAFSALDRLFGIGNGTSVGARSDAFIILKNGLATLPSVTNALIDADTTGKALVTKEYVNNRLVLEKSGNYTLVDADSGGIVIFTASATLTIPTGLAAGFECTFVTLAGVTLTVSAGVNTLYNNTGTTLLPQLSFTLKRMIAADTYIATGNL